MKEIKFRAWCSVDKMMFNWKSLSSLPVLFADIMKGKAKHYKPMQYTGLKDKNGVEIYEGDIVKSLHNNKHYPVEFGRCYLFDEDGDDLGVFYGFVWAGSPFSCDVYDSTDKYEVIGNIYENQELLKAP